MPKVTSARPRKTRLLRVATARHDGNGMVWERSVYGTISLMSTQRLAVLWMDCEPSEMMMLGSRQTLCCVCVLRSILDTRFRLCACATVCFCMCVRNHPCVYMCVSVSSYFGWSKHARPPRRMCRAPLVGPVPLVGHGASQDWKSDAVQQQNAVWSQHRTRMWSALRWRRKGMGQTERDSDT